jgi:hypothetical protein
MLAWPSSIASTYVNVIIAALDWVARTGVDLSLWTLFHAASSYRFLNY